MKLEDALAFLFGEGLPCSTCKGKGTVPDPNFRSWGREEARPRDVPCPDCQYGENEGARPGLILASREARALAALIRATQKMDPPPDLALSVARQAKILADHVLERDQEDDFARSIAVETRAKISELKDYGVL